MTVAKELNFPEGSYVVMKLELANLQSVRDFVANLKAFKSARPVNNLICNAAVYKPTDPEPAWTDDGFEMSMVSTNSDLLYNPSRLMRSLYLEPRKQYRITKNHPTFIFHKGSKSSWTFPSCKSSPRRHEQS